MGEKVVILSRGKGKFIYANEKSAIIVNYLMGYKIFEGKVGFPEVALGKVMACLEKNKLSFKVVDGSLVKESSDLKNVSNYDDVFTAALIVLEKKTLIEKISDKLNCLDKDKLSDLLDYVEKL